MCSLHDLTSLAAQYDPDPGDTLAGPARNRRASAHGAAALVAYLGCSGCSHTHDPDDLLADLLADLWHTAERLGLDMPYALTRAEGYYRGERE